MSMMQTNRRLGRPPVQAEAVMRELRDRILAGHLQPGSQVKKRVELEAQLGVSQVTIQSVMNDLIEDGFLHVRPKRGTFVVDHPPHLCHFAMVMPFRREDPAHQSKFYDALVRAVEGMPVRPERRLKLYWAATEEQHVESKRLIEDLERRRLAGLVFVGPVHIYRNSPVLAKADAKLPRVSICVNEKGYVNASVYPDFEKWMHMAMARFAELGRRKVAMVANTIDGAGWHQRFTQKINEYGLSTLERWMQFHSNVESELGTRHAARGLWAGSAEHRPDGLLLPDDNLVEPVLKGLREEGCRIGEDIHVVAHANFPTEKLVGVDQLGFEVGDLVNWSIDLLSKCKQEQSVPSLTLQSPRFV